MSYIVTAKVDLNDEMNLGAKAGDVRARTLSLREGMITFDVPGDFQRTPEIVKGLCDSLIEAGFLSFSISHSY